MGLARDIQNEAEKEWKMMAEEDKARYNYDFDVFLSTMIGAEYLDII